MLVACFVYHSKGRNYRIVKTAMKKLIILLTAVFINSRKSYVIVPVTKVMFALVSSLVSVTKSMNNELLVG